MRRFFINRKAIKQNRVVIDGDEARHIRDVIRLKVDDRFLGFDGSGKTYTLRIERLANIVEAEIEKVSSMKLDMPRVLLACALPKARKIEFIIEKATELGVSEIVPMVTERTIVKISDKNKTTKQKRWEKIALETAKQCGRDRLPKIYQAMKFKDAVKLTESLGYMRKIMPCLSEETEYLNEVLSGNIKEAAVFIGPEGDFTKREIDYAKTRGFDLISLGPLVLKVDTACLFTISIIQARAFE